MAGGFAQAQPAKDYQPEVGQAGKDVVWVPTPQALVDKMLEMAKVTPKDYVIDLGSGDGRTVITAAKRGSKALGIEYNPDMVELSKRNAAKEGVSDKATFMKADLFESDFSQAQVITMFLLPSINLKLRPKILDLKPGTRIVSNSFDMEEWKPDETVNGRGLHQLVHGASVDRAGKSGRHVEAAARRAGDQANISDDLRHAQERQRRLRPSTASSTAIRSPLPPAALNTPAGSTAMPWKATPAEPSGARRARNRPAVTPSPARRISAMRSALSQACCAFLIPALLYYQLTSIAPIAVQ